MSPKEVLEAIGLSKKETTVYLASLYMGPASLLALSRAAKMHRPQLYKHVDELIDKGVMQTTLEGKRRLYFAVEPKKLVDLLKQKEQLLNQFLPEITALSYLGRQKPRITYYEGREKVQELLRTQNEAKHKEIHAFFPSKYMIELFGQQELEKVIAERIRRGIQVKLLRSAKTEQDYEGSSHRRKALREVRHIPDDKAFAMGIVLFDNKINLFAPVKESYGLQIESNALSDLLRYMFEQLWQNSTDIK